MFPVCTVQPVMAVELGASSWMAVPGSIPNSKLPLTTRLEADGGGGGVRGVIDTLSSAAPPSPSVRLTKLRVKVALEAGKSRVFKVQPRLESLKPVASKEYSCEAAPMLARSRLIAGKGGINSGLPAMRKASRYVPPTVKPETSLLMLPAVVPLMSNERLPSPATQALP